MQRLLGWWLFDPEHALMAHETTGQKLHFLGRLTRNQLDITTSNNRVWVLFLYEDHETRFPLAVEWRNVPSKTAGRPLVWRVDYLRSSILWRQKVNTALAYPEYGLWRRVDDFLTDALACWPAHSKTGPHARYLALNGGWLNGTWTEAYYRCVSCASPIQHRTDPFQKTSLTPCAQKPPSAWNIVAPNTTDIEHHIGKSLIGHEEIYTQILEAARNRPYLTTKDHSRILIALLGATPRYRLKRFSGFFYSDQYILTDAIHMGIHDVTPHQVPHRTIVIEKNTPLGLLSRDTQAPIPWEHVESNLTGGIISKADYIPYDIGRNIIHASFDAWLTYPSEEWMGAGENAETLSAPPATLYIKNWQLSGSHVETRVEAATTIRDLPDGRPHPLAHLFDEENDGIIRGSSPIATVGFWEFDPPSQSLVNRLLGQRLRYESGFAEKKESGPREQVWRFHYEDADVSYPLVVRPHTRTHNTGQITYSWLVDHERSKIIWQQNSGQKHPPFGLWQRVNECVLDALLCWPEIEATGSKPYSIISIGGWFNGAWSTNISRRRERGYDHGFGKNSAPITPFLQDLNVSTHAWEFVDAPRAIRGAKLARVREINHGKLYLPAEEPLTGFEGEIPYMRRDDGKAVMFPAGLTSTLFRGEDYTPEASILYGDENLFFCFKAKEFGGFGAFPSSWTFYPYRMVQIGLRRIDDFDPAESTGIPSRYFLEQPSRFGAAFPVPSPALAQCLINSLVDAGLAWSGSSQRLLDDPEHWRGMGGIKGIHVPPYEKSGIDLNQKSQVRIEGGYVGGLYNTTSSTTAWIADNPFKV